MTDRNAGRSERPDRPPRGGSRSDSGNRDRRPARDDGRGRGTDRRGRDQEPREFSERPAWQTRVERVRDDSRPKSPMIPEEITENDLDLLVRVQFKTLSPENAERVARHLAMVNLLIDQDPELAHRHAVAAAERAGRIAVVRETLGVTAYTVGDFALALRELQTYRRLSGSNDQLPLMVDSERGLGRPEKALEMGRSVDRSTLEPGVRVNLAIAMSGARLDRNENELALAELQIEELNPRKVLDYSPHLFRAYAHTLEILNRDSEAKQWHELADRAEVALATKKAPAAEVFSVIEEITIPEPYESRPPRPERGTDSERLNRDRSTRQFDRPSRSEGSRQDRGNRGDGARQERGGRGDSTRPERGVRATSPRRDRDDRVGRSRDDRGQTPRSASGGSEAPQDPQERPQSSSPWKRPNRDEEK